MNDKCKCPLAEGFCDRHGVHKTTRKKELCAGVNCTLDQNAMYWNKWEAGRGRGQAKAPDDPQPIAGRIGGPSGRRNKPGRGRPGDHLESILTGWGITKVEGCGCESFRNRMNQWGVEGCRRERETIVDWLVDEAARRGIPFAKTWAARVIAGQWVDSSIRKAEAEEAVQSAMPQVEALPLLDPPRNLMMHLWPHKDTGAWQWNLDQILARRDLFTGKKVLAIARDSSTSPPHEVIEYSQGLFDEVIVARNIRRLREVVTFEKLLSQIEPTEGVTFACHGKGVQASHGGIGNKGTTVHDWADIMYKTCLDYWPLVIQQLRTKAMTGSFKRYGSFATPGNHRWHYSGTFYWFRNQDVFSRNWRKIDQQFFGSESWPGHLFKPEETGCLFFDGVDDLYKTDYWRDEVNPRFEEWSKKHADLLLRQLRTA